MRHCFKILTGLLFTAAAGLRVLLWWANPPLNAFDNHFEPIFWIMKYGHIAPKDALWQSYQPPVFYVISALIGRLAQDMGVAVEHGLKILQFMPCLYDLLTVGVVYLILKKMPLSAFSRLLAFGFVCFLPRHIYMSAMHTNDTLSALFVALCVYLMLTALERKFPVVVTVPLSISITVALFTKYTAFVVIPMALFILTPVFLCQIILPRKKLIDTCLLLIFVPLVFLGSYCYSNFKDYHHPLPWNNAILAPANTQPKAESKLRFTDFKPWQTIKTPILTPRNISSFWTLIHSRMWFDVEPKFLYFQDPELVSKETAEESWWPKYYQWLRGEKPFPYPIQLPPLVRFTGSALIALGLVPLLFIGIGICRSIFGTFSMRNKMYSEKVIKGQLLLVLLLFNTAGVIALALKSPVFSSVKAAYFLGSTPAFSVFLGLGVMACEKHRLVRWILSFAFGGLFVLVALHIVHIASFALVIR